MKKNILFLFCFSLIISNFSLSQVGWVNQSGNLPYTYQHSYNSVFAINSTTCFLATGCRATYYIDSNRYTVCKTTNGGVIWTTISGGSNYYIN